MGAAAAHLPAAQTTLQVLRNTGAWDHLATRSSSYPNLKAILIDEPAAWAHRDHGPSELWGMRAQESRGRAAAYATALRDEVGRNCNGCCANDRDRATHGGLIRRVDGTTAFGPVWDWKTADIWAHIGRHALPVNPVYAKLARLGAPEHFLRVSHMIDGGRLEEGLVTWLRRGWPALFHEPADVLPRIREFV